MQLPTMLPVEKRGDLLTSSDSPLAKWAPTPKTIKAVLICFVWYAGSMINSIAGKSAMRTFPYPTTVGMVQLLVINFVLPWFKRGKGTVIRRRDWLGWIVPLSFLKILVTLSSQLSILKVPVSYAHTVKALMPIFTVVLSKLFLNQTHSMLAYLSLVPIMGGVIICSVTELEFNLVGLLSALFSTFIFAVQNIFSKKVMKSGVNHISILIEVSRVSFFLLLPFWFFHEGLAILSGTEENHLPADQMHVIWFKVFLCALGNSFQTVFAFTFLSLVTPVTYSVANVAKRVVVIVAATMIFHNPITYANAAGIGITMLGIAIYNKAKLDEKAAQAAIASLSKTLPLHAPFLNKPGEPLDNPYKSERVTRDGLSNGDPVSEYTRQRLTSSTSMGQLSQQHSPAVTPQGRRVPTVEQI
eukprot:m.63470 g.63470  ORF g.63470 m.63470 type:complete len:413 (+) comp13970_c0_seq1:136-1374(+)